VTLEKSAVLFVRSRGSSLPAVGAQRCSPDDPARKRRHRGPSPSPPHDRYPSDKNPIGRETDISRSAQGASRPASRTNACAGLAGFSMPQALRSFLRFGKTPTPLVVAHRRHRAAGPFRRRPKPDARKSSYQANGSGYMRRCSTKVARDLCPTSRRRPARGLLHPFRKTSIVRRDSCRGASSRKKCREDAAGGPTRIPTEKTIMTNFARAVDRPTLGEKKRAF